MERIRYINGIKGICAMLVLISHMSLSFINESSIFQAWANRWIFIRFLNADFAVHLFIMISSFLAYNSIKRCGQCSELLLKRYFRLAIPISCILIAMGILQYLGLFYSETAGSLLNSNWLIGESRSLSDLYKAILMAPFGMYYGWLNPLWMLKYILFAPFFVVIFMKLLENVKGNATIWIILLTLMLFLRYDFYYNSIIIGFILAQWGHRVPNPIIWIAGILLLMSHFVQFFCLNQMGAALALLICVKSTNVQRCLSINILNKLGELSMGIYLVHVPILYSISSYIYLILLDNPMKMPIVEISTVLSTLLFAFLYKKYVESYSAKIVSGIVAQMQKS